MAYSRTTWQDRAVQNPNTYVKSGETTSEITLIPKPGTVTQAGTPISATNMNKIETALESILGSGNASIMQKVSMTLETDTRTTEITRNTAGKVTLLEEKNGATVIKSTKINYDTSNAVTSIVETAGGVSVTYKLNKDVFGKVNSVTKTV